MDKIRYSSPDLSTDIFDVLCSLLSESMNSSASSSIEDFTDNNDMITW